MWDRCEVDQKYYTYTITEPTKEDLLLDSLCVPSQTQVRQQLGSKLAEIFFENLSSQGRILLGFVPPLSGPEKVWVEPGSRLETSVTCKLVPEPQVLNLKALTHKTIQDLGQECIDTLNTISDYQIDLKLNRQTRILEEECKQKVKEALENAKIEADEHCSQVVRTLMEHFDKCFREVVTTLTFRTRKECQFRLLEEKHELAALVLNHLEDQAQKHNLSNFDNILCGELSALVTELVQQLDAEKEATELAIEDITEKYETMLLDLKLDLEVDGVFDVCQAVPEMESNMERKNSDTSSKFKNLIILLLKTIAALGQRNESSYELITEYEKRIEYYKNKIALLVEEFHKIINLGLNAAAPYEEVLLTTQKMLLSDYLEEDDLPNAECYESYKTCIAEKILTEKAEEVDVEKVAKPCVMKMKKKKKKKCLLELHEKEEDCKYAFNYNEFKYNLVKNVIEDVELDDKKKCSNRSESKNKKDEGTWKQELQNYMKEYENLLRKCKTRFKTGLDNRQLKCMKTNGAHKEFPLTNDKSSSRHLQIL